jgi:hypothetical protein
MRNRISIWASVGILVGCCWIVYSFAMPPDDLIASLRNPIVGALASSSLSISIAGRYFAIRFWWIPPISAATYAAVGLMVETLRSKLNSRFSLNRPAA